MSTMITATGLWKNTSKDGGKTYLVGRLGGVKVMVFKNENKKEDKHPDYNLVLTEWERQDKKPVDQPTEENPF